MRDAQDVARDPEVRHSGGGEFFAEIVLRDFAGGEHDERFSFCLVGNAADRDHALAFTAESEGLDDARLDGFVRHHLAADF